MQRIHVVGRKNHGKTRLVTGLVQHLSGLGLRVGTIKHTHHRHELDTEGKDSWQHRQAGATLVGVLSQQLTAIFLPTPGHSGPADENKIDERQQVDGQLVDGQLVDGRRDEAPLADGPLADGPLADGRLVDGPLVDGRREPTGPVAEDARYATLEPLYAGCDLVIVEGNLQTTSPKIEVWREELGSQPLYLSDEGIEVVVTDSPLTLTPPRFTLLPTAIESLADWVLYRLREKTG